MKMSQGPAKIFIQVESVEEQQEHLKASRKTLKVLQKAATPITINKENLIGRGGDGQTRLKEALVHSSSAKDVLESKRKKLTTSASQTSPESKAITAEDLTSQEEPINEEYWKVLAEKRRVALLETIDENVELHERVAKLEDELNLSHQMLEETRNLVEVLTEMLQENEDATASDDEAAKPADDQDEAD